MTEENGELRGCITKPNGIEERQYCKDCNMKDDAKECLSFRQRVGARKLYKKSIERIIQENPHILRQPEIRPLPEQAKQTLEQIRNAKSVEELYVICDVAQMQCNLPGKVADE